MVDPRYAYQMVDIMTGVVQRGTAAALRALNRPLAGKTGTSNDAKDVWFIGFSPDLVCGVYVGFDTPKSLGAKETGGSVAVPIFKAFMSQALADVPPTPFRMPRGLRLVRVNPANGQLAQFGDNRAIWEAFLPGTEPNPDQPQVVLDGSSQGAGAMTGDPNATAGFGTPQPGIPAPPTAATLGTGGLY